MIEREPDSLPQSGPFAWLIDQWNWPATTLFAAGLLLILTPLWWQLGGLALTLVYVQLPVYMLHQWEEHSGDRFRRYINQTIGHGREALTPVATFWINALGVWAVDLVALYLAVDVHLSFGLIAIYLPLVNSLGHIVPSLIRREYNPGLWTTLGLFLPVGVWSLVYVAKASGATIGMHALGIGVAVVVHAAIMIHVVRRLKRLPAQSGR